MTRRRLLLYGLFFLLSDTHAQLPAPDTASSRRDVDKSYRQYLNFEAPLFNGPVYNDYRHNISNSLPFIKTAELQSGSVKYDGILYEDILLNYDVFKDELVIQNPSNQKIFMALKPRLNYFELSGTRFTMVHHSREGIQPGIYEVVYSGAKIEVLLKHTKELDENITGYTTQFSFTAYKKFYIKKGDTYVKVDNTRSMLKILGDKEGSIRKFMEGRKLSMKDDARELLVHVAAYYDQL